MNFAFSKSQTLLVDSVREFLQKEAKDVAREAEKTNEGYSPELWRKMGELGWMGLIFPEEYGGHAGDFLELILILKEMGKVLVPGPFISTICSGLSILKYGTEAQKNEILQKLVEGNNILALAFIHPSGKHKGKDVILSNGDFLLNGTRILVPYAHVADWFIYKTEINQDVTFLLVSSRSPGVNCSVLKTIGSDMQHEIRFNNVEVPKENILGNKSKGKEIENEIEKWGALCQSAYILGLLERVLEMTVDHSKKREQFERPIGSFQSIQHQCADMATEIDKIKFLIYRAAWNLSSQLAAEKDISMAKALVSDASRTLCLLGVKIHGGLGVSEEHDMQLYFRRAKAGELTFGDGDFHREVIAQQLGL